MPATEQYWRNLKTLHVVFGVSALAMLLTTVWMLAADHAREAKNLQKQFNLVETRSLEWRKTEQLTGEYEVKRQELEARLADARTAVPKKATIDAFVETAEKRKENGYNTAAVSKA